MKVLEIGCGQGFFSSVLSSSKDKKITGIDLSSKDIDIAKKRYPHINFLWMNAEKLKFKKDMFDEIYALDVLEHVDNLERVLSEVSRVIKKGGLFYVNIPAEKSEKWLLKLRPNYFKEIHHVRIFKNEQLDNYLKGKEFILIKKKPRGFIQHIELYYLFTSKNKANSQLSVGNWRSNWMSKFVHITLLFFDPIVLKTPLRYLPIWLITLPLGSIVNGIGNKFFPKSIYYIFKKK